MSPLDELELLAFECTGDLELAQEASRAARDTIVALVTIVADWCGVDPAVLLADTLVQLGIE